MSSCERARHQSQFHGIPSVCEIPMGPVPKRPNAHGLENRVFVALSLKQYFSLTQIRAHCESGADVRDELLEYSWRPGLAPGPHEHVQARRATENILNDCLWLFTRGAVRSGRDTLATAGASCCLSSFYSVVAIWRYVPQAGGLVGRLRQLWMHGSCMIVNPDWCEHLDTAGCCHIPRRRSGCAKAAGDRYEEKVE